MARLKISKSILEKARERAILDAREKTQLAEVTSESGKQYSGEASRLPRPLLMALLDDSRLSPNQRATIALQVHGMGGAEANHDDVYSTACLDPVDFGSTFIMLGQKKPNCEIFLNGRWYPIVLLVNFGKDDGNLTRSVHLVCHLSLCELTYTRGFRVPRDLFLDEDGQQRERTVEEILNYFNLRRLEATPSEFNVKLVRAERASREQGQVVLVAGPVLEFNEQSWWARLESKALGCPENPRRCVIEPELEISQDYRGYYSPGGHDEEQLSRLPFVRTFSLTTKRYVFADVDDVLPCEFDSQAMSRLHLPEGMLGVLSRVFNTPVDELFGDIIEGKHGGVVVLACGNPGVGKTLTAEVYAETTERPLYVLELGELGTNVEQVEENLSRVFTRVARWNAVLQFDECEIFLTERGEDLNRSAIVGIFLRLLDYYQGILFLTTNRPDVLDHAVRSRVMLRLDYPDLDQDSRAAIWETMFEAAGLSLTEGSLHSLAEATINGRQIRNLSRLARILYPEGGVTLDQMRAVLTYGCA